MSYHRFSIAYAYACLVLLVSGQVELPAGIKTCKRDSEDFTSCLRLAIQESWPVIVKGIPELGIPILDPLFTEYQETSYENGELHGKISIMNANAYGLAQIRFLSLKPEFTENYFKLEIGVAMPKMLIESDYKADGRLGSFKIGGKGYCNISMEDIKGDWILEGPVENDRWIIEHFHVQPEVGKMKIWFSDLFNGNEELNKVVMEFVNEYWPGIYRGMIPYITKTWDNFLSDFANLFFSKIPFSKVFP